MNTRYLTTPDGTRLATDLQLPDGVGPFPAVLIRTPYDRLRHRAELRGWAARGFAALAQDVRGRHASHGKWHPYRAEAEDGAAALEWIRRQPWSDGRVVACGASYAAHCALAIAGDAPGTGRTGAARADAVIAAVPALGAAETAREQTGPERLFARAGWWAAHGDRRDSDESALAKALADDPALLAHLPVRDLPRRIGRELPSWAGLWSQRQHYAPPPAPCPPLLAVGGTHDPFAEDTLRLWRGWNGPARLLLGPWGHGLTAEPGSEAGAAHWLRIGELYVDWARAALEGGLDAGRAGAVALGGSELWLSADELAAVPAVHSLDGMRLLRGPAFRADPGLPVRSDDLEVPRTGPADRCLLVGAPLPRPLDLLGPAEARLRVTADTDCADWVVRLVALTVDDVAAPLATGVVRRASGGRGSGVGSALASGSDSGVGSGVASAVGSGVASGVGSEVTVPLGHLARRLPAGTRLRLEIAGHHFPAHARNPHTGADPLTATRLLASERTVDLAASALLLPVAPPRNLTHAVHPVQEICR
ncbi:CocE/NonD family hydrolase [Streptomyces apocyni]|uniref:CocE/NonD family hydrolase n=1 Tax=Streptomyces apocyni TaxID=2654677 RepID=UPI0012EA3044|nr:CocE/NonD family hydrolase [Streptomyces apocyni]